MKKNHIIFAHIPKTAGTSFRLSLEHIVPKDKIALDYGRTSKETSNLIRNTVYQKAEQKFLQHMDSVRVLFGHFQDSCIRLRGYRKLLPKAMLCTVLRDPITRIISEYYHFRHYFGYQESFDTFFHQVPFINRQSKCIDSIPLCAFDFVGITEHYSESLKLFTKISSLELIENFVNLRANTNLDALISQADLDNFARLNIEDIAIYNEALYRFHYQSGLRFPSSAHRRFEGSIGPGNNGMVAGWAVDHSSYRPVEIKVFRGRRMIFSEVACLYRPDVRKAGLHISGYCGFSIPFEKLQENNKNSLLVVHVEGCGVLGKIPAVVEPGLLHKQARRSATQTQ
ncbi:MAG: hypothetical protein BGO99_11725 [Nitrosospira sp. 56-18]|jgi:hypothetical protein|nr:sulfotransferase family 2 domain-containing protein [Nitrosospira sp.]OJY09403.1 MAG: hypothetical protein BGO99_11725 [Nitrosospira sp. 56-18]